MSNDTRIPYERPAIAARTTIGPILVGALPGSPVGIPDIDNDT
jgi:hypothetical protein